VQPDGSLLAKALPEGQITPGAYALSARTALEGITAIKLEALPDPSLPNNGPGLAPDGNFVLSEFIVTASPMDAKRAKRGAGPTLTKARASFEQKSFSVMDSLKKGNRDRGWAVSPEGGYRHEAIFEFNEPLSFAGGATLNFNIQQAFQGGMYNLGRFRLSVTTAKSPRFGVSSDVATALRTPMGKRTKEQAAAVTGHFLAQHRDLQTQNKIVAAARKRLPTDPLLADLQRKATDAEKPITLDPQLVQLRRDAGLSAGQFKTQRLTAAQDLAWALINSSGFLFNH
jgi:hypothetical protein